MLITTKTLTKNNRERNDDHPFNLINNSFSILQGLEENPKEEKIHRTTTTSTRKSRRRSTYHHDDSSCTLISHTNRSSNTCIQKSSNTSFLRNFVDLPSEILIYIFDFIVPLFHILSHHAKEFITHEEILIRLIPQFFKIQISPPTAPTYYQYNREQYTRLFMENQVPIYAERILSFLLEDVIENSFVNFLLISKQCFYRVFVTECSENDSIRLLWEFLGSSIQNCREIAETILLQAPFKPKPWLYLFGGTQHAATTNDLIASVIKLQNSSDHFVELYLNKRFRLYQWTNNIWMFALNPVLKPTNEQWRDYLNLLRKKFKQHTQLTSNPIYVMKLSHTMSTFLNSQYVQNFAERQYRIRTQKKCGQKKSSIRNRENKERERMYELLKLIYVECKVPITVSIENTDVQCVILNAICMACEMAHEYSNIDSTDIFTTVLSSNILHNDILTKEEKEQLILDLLFNNCGMLTSLFLTFRFEQLFNLLQLLEGQDTNNSTRKVHANESVSHLLEYFMENIKMIFNCVNHSYIVQTLCNVLSRVWRLHIIDISLTAPLNRLIKHACAKMSVFEDETLKKFVLTTFETLLQHLYSLYRPYEIFEALNMQGNCLNNRTRMGHVILENSLRNVNIFEIVLTTPFQQSGHDTMMKTLSVRQVLGQEQDLPIYGPMFTFLVPTCCWNANVSRKQDAHSEFVSPTIFDAVLSISFNTKGRVTNYWSRRARSSITSKEQDDSMPLEKLMSRMNVLRKYIGHDKCIEILQNHPSFVNTLKLYIQQQEKSHIVKVMLARLVDLLKEWGIDMEEEKQTRKK
ncbi:hypothetical protein C9374_005659 [Naegleria lovaniensis]|uniref:Uncharacterized protein n=1 Tax=Naegleria lovaniensis TaxID=51637 RepID=A0AA88GP24_NAELO|nr:uncharacterized protein C9374_005659 [Naegleria lovaniensis]KAG2381867.1 hypothetical protein C9374_005659 [Naegleria lovaniensis]